MATDFGRDLWCRNQLVSTRYARGVELVVNAIIRRIRTAKGTLKYHPNYGIDLELIGLELVPGTIARIEAELVAQVEAERRVLAGSVAVSVTPVVLSDRTNLQISISGACAAGPFDFVTTIDRVTLEILGVRRAA